MVLKYKEYARLKRGLDGGVSAVAFSPDATYIAVAGTFDNTVYLWRVAERKLVETYKGSSPYLSMRWLPGRTDELLCGSRGGCVDHLKLTHVSFSPTPIDVYEQSQGALTVKGFRAHERPVECLAVSSSLLATGAQCEVTVWKDLHGGAYRRLIDLPPPPRSSHNEDSEVLATGIHWTKSRKYSSLLLVSYMFHGIVIYDASTWNSVRYIPTPGLVAGSSVTPDGSLFAVSNVMTGFDVYDMDTTTCVGGCPNEAGALRAVPVLFVHEGHALFGGSTAGRVHLWNVNSRRIHQTFHLGAEDQVLAIDAHYNRVRDRFLLAAGVSNGGNSRVVIWIARKCRTVPSSSEYKAPAQVKVIMDAGHLVEGCPTMRVV
ncbi:hypothetical protein NUW54_g8058 [Trametes sanguinea]|uniref:Uncharacterized protein n=1 Tax=Trametes sanguinea TaxID=158606 RepID=A0ACC1PIS8_9APHY|nr:hypothetical protein NUW54_g8058 [Trametes sanguinea]